MQLCVSSITHLYKVELELVLTTLYIVNWSSGPQNAARKISFCLLDVSLIFAFIFDILDHLTSFIQEEKCVFGGTAYSV